MREFLQQIGCSRAGSGPGEADQLAPLAQLVEQISERPLLQGNHITPLINGDEAYPAMLTFLPSGLLGFVYPGHKV